MCCMDIQYHHRPAASIIGGHTYTHSLSRNVQMNAHAHRLLPHSGGNYSRKSGVIIALTRPQGDAGWRLGGRTVWKRLNVQTRCWWEVRVWVYVCVCVWGKVRETGSDWFIMNDMWLKCLLFYLLCVSFDVNHCMHVCLFMCVRVLIHDSTSFCVHACISVYQCFQIHCGQC